MIGHNLAQAIETTTLSLAPSTRAVEVSTALVGPKICAILHNLYNLAEEKMKSIVFLDEQHIKALGIFRTFSKEDGEIRWCSTHDKAFKFIVDNDGMLFIAPVYGHKEVYAIYTLWYEPTDEAKPLIDEIVHRWPENWCFPVTGAGEISVDGRVTSWKSEGFRVETPSYMREEIEQEVARLFKTGELTPR